MKPEQNLSPVEMFFPVDWYDNMKHPCGKEERAELWADKAGFKVLTFIRYDISKDQILCLVEPLNQEDIETNAKYFHIGKGRRNLALSSRVVNSALRLCDIVMAVGVINLAKEGQEEIKEVMSSVKCLREFHNET